MLSSSPTIEREAGRPYRPSRLTSMQRAVLRRSHEPTQNGMEPLQINAHIGSGISAAPGRFSSDFTNNLFRGGTSGFSRTGATGVRFKIASDTTPLLSPSRASLPVAISYSTIPEHVSSVRP